MSISTITSKLKFVSAFMIMTTLGLALPAQADVRIDIKNTTTEECSVAFNARTGATTWVTLGWFVFVPNEEAPVILKDANDIHDIYIYHDCGMKVTEDDETKKGYVRVNFKFTDDMPKENEDGYQAVNFVRLKSGTYNIGGRN